VVPPLRLVPEPEGLLQIHTAPFRGSFAAVFSQAIRSAGLGSRVLVSQFLKGGVEQGVEGSLWLCGRLQWLRPAMQECLGGPLPGADAALDGTPEGGGSILRGPLGGGDPAGGRAVGGGPDGPGGNPERPGGNGAGGDGSRGESGDGHPARTAVREVWNFTARRLGDGDVDLMVLDELGLAIALGYLEAGEVVASLARRPHQVDVILTGPAIPPALMDMADQVTELRRNC
jgi:cob(I)alamin adenosyltransferase